MIDLARAKLHCKVDGDDEDDLIQGYIDAAVAHVEQHCDRTLVETPTGPEQMAYTKDVDQAILLLVGHWYANREAVTIGAASSKVDFAVGALLWYRKRF